MHAQGRAALLSLYILNIWRCPRKKEDSWLPSIINQNPDSYGPTGDMKFYLFILFASLAATTPIVFGGGKQDPLCPADSCGVQGDEFNFLGQAVTNRTTNPDFATREGCGNLCAAEPSCIVYSVGRGVCTRYRLPQ